LRICIESAKVEVGFVNASGKAGGAAAPELVSQVGQNGAPFVLPQAVTLVVEGDLPCVVGCTTAGAGAASADLIASGRLQWRHAGEHDWTSFGPGDEGRMCLTNADGGSRVYVLDVRLRVESNDPPGPFAARLAFDLAPVNGRSSPA
jgi:hypothetical protein